MCGGVSGGVVIGGEWLSSRMKVYLDGRTGELKEWSLRSPPSPSDAVVPTLRRASRDLFTTHLASFPGYISGMGMQLIHTYGHKIIVCTLTSTSPLPFTLSSRV